MPEEKKEEKTRKTFLNAMKSEGNTTGVNASHIGLLPQEKTQAKNGASKWQVMKDTVVKNNFARRLQLNLGDVYSAQAKEDYVTSMTFSENRAKSASHHFSDSTRSGRVSLAALALQREAEEGRNTTMFVLIELFWVRTDFFHL